MPHSGPNSRALRVDPIVQPACPVMSFGIYLGGVLLVLGGLIYVAAMLHAPTPWIVAGALIVLGLGILTAVKATRQRDPAG